jgi:hypothetical protein
MWNGGSMVFSCLEASVKRFAGADAVELVVRV